VVKGRRIRVMLAEAMEHARSVIQLKRAEQLLRIAQFEVDNAGDMIVRVGSAGRVLFANNAACLMTGYSKDEMSSLYIWQLNLDIRRQEWPGTWERRKGEKQAQLEVVGLRKDGATFPLDIVLNFLEFEGNEFIIITGRDISQKKLAEEELKEAERKYRELAESLPQVVFEAENDGMITFANENAFRLFGYRKEELEGNMRTFDLLADGQQERSMQSLAFVYEEGSARSREFLGKNKDGSTFPVLVSANLVVREGNPVGIRGVVVDITEQKEAEARARRIADAFQDVFNGANDALFIRGLAGNFLEVNDVACKLIGRSHEELLTMSPKDLDSPEFADSAERRTEDIIRDGNAVFETQIVSKDGKVIPVEVSSKVITYFDVPAILSIVRDITERKEAEQALQRVNVELEGYAHTVSHDILGPLTSVIVGAETLNVVLTSGAGPPDPEAVMELGEIIESGAKKAGDLVTDLLKLAEAGQEPHEVEELRVSEVVESVVTERAAQIERKGIEVDVDPELGTVRANKTQIYQLFENLVGNAIKHSDSPAPRIEVRLVGESDGRHTYLVRDNGGGIPDEDLNKVFLPFYKRSATGGTGIGLATVRKIVEVYGGTVRAYNDGGACFEFTIADAPAAAD
jgi:PAS domain S-box-containing protein